MNIFSVIKKDHDNGRMLMQQIVETENAEPRLEIFKELKTAILAHAKSEEKTFYTALKEGKDRELAEDVPHLKEDHKAVEKLFEEIEGIEPNNYMWWEKFGELKMGLEHHMQEEEKQIFPEAKAEIPAQKATNLGEEMEVLEEKQKEKLEAA